MVSLAECDVADSRCRLLHISCPSARGPAQHLASRCQTSTSCAGLPPVLQTTRTQVTRYS